MTSNDATGLHPIPFQVLEINNYLGSTVVAGRNVAGADPGSKTTGPKSGAKDKKEVDLNPPPELVIHHDQGVEFIVDIIAIGNGGKYIYEETTNTQGNAAKPRGRDELPAWMQVDWMQVDGRRLGERDRDREREPRQETADAKTKTPLNWFTNPKMLPSIIPNGRMLEFRYSEEQGIISNLRLLAENFLSRVSNDCGSRPVIFITYGRGGLVLEMAIMMWYAQQRSHPELTSPQKPKHTTKSSLPAPGQSSSSASIKTTAPTIHQLPPNVPSEQTKSVLPKTETSKSQPSQSSSPPADDHHDIQGPKQPAVECKTPHMPAIPLPPINSVAGILFLGLPLETPISTQIPDGTHYEDKQALETLVDAWVKTPEIKSTSEDPTRTAYDSCFNGIVNKIGIATRFYQGNEKNKDESRTPPVFRV